MENKKIIAALAEFQKLCPAIKKDSTAGSGNFTYKYGSLPAILEAIKPHLETTGLMFTQPMSLNDEQRCIITTLYHIESGESLQSVIDIPDVDLKGMNFYQSLGSGITYLRRYALTSILGIVADEDNDGAGEPEKPKTETKSKEKPELKPMIFDKVNINWKKAVDYIVSGKPIEDIEKKYKISAANKKKLIKESDDILFPENKK